ncbi:unnamed protein product [Rotaria socialis]|uniref:SRCR domain-containing protein n=1 Tax=Rotaria socialis TaxID=392032 RepID=A0A817VRG7_9BILA|nr:unnamed protein product [Rotaria socialis]CAF4450468.1 unnamed protein product [Rotaria socialis]
MSLIILLGWIVLLSSVLGAVPPCDPRTFSTGSYPGRLISIDVTGYHPLKLRAHMRLANSTDEISFEGMVFVGTTLPSAAATTVCRSLGCSEYTVNARVYWTPHEDCLFTCPDGKSAKRTCSFMLSSFACKADAMNLAECQTGSFWAESNMNPSTNSGVQVVCADCGEN